MEFESRLLRRPNTRSALEHLLGGPCYHGAVPLVERPEHVLPWLEVFNSGKLEADVADKLLEGYKAGLDVIKEAGYMLLPHFMARWNLTS